MDQRRDGGERAVLPALVRLALVGDDRREPRSRVIDSGRGRAPPGIRDRLTDQLGILLVVVGHEPLPRESQFLRAHFGSGPGVNGEPTVLTHSNPHYTRFAETWRLLTWAL